MKKILAIAFTMIFASACSPLVGTWHFKSTKQLSCKSPMQKVSSCKTDWKLPGKFRSCMVEIEGKLIFSGNKEGKVERELRTIVKCPNLSPMKRRSKFSGEFFVGEEGGRKYLYVKLKEGKFKMLMELKRDMLSLFAGGRMQFRIVMEGGKLVMKKMYLLQVETWER